MLGGATPSAWLLTLSLSIRVIVAAPVVEYHHSGGSCQKSPRTAVGSSLVQKNRKRQETLSNRSYTTGSSSSGSGDEGAVPLGGITSSFATSNGSATSNSAGVAFSEVGHRKTGEMDDATHIASSADIVASGYSMATQPHDSAQDSAQPTDTFSWRHGGLNSWLKELGLNYSRDPHAVVDQKTKQRIMWVICFDLAVCLLGVCMSCSLSSGLPVEPRRAVTVHRSVDA